MVDVAAAEACLSRVGKAEAIPTNASEIVRNQQRVSGQMSAPPESSAHDSMLPSRSPSRDMLEERYKTISM
jgi:hypothetical protein